jgi:site-specific recombinase XerD
MTLEQNPYRHFKIKASKGKRNFLSVSEVKKLMNYDLPAKELMLEKTRDLFLFSCLTGPRYGDIINLRWSNIKSDPDMIALTMSKTSKDIKIPLNDYAKEILNKYGKYTIKTPQGNVFPEVQNQVLNRNLKDLMELVGINKLISFHCGRHTMASNMIEAGVSILYIKDLLGHSSLTETQVYAKSLTGDLISTMQNMANMYSHAV